MNGETGTDALQNMTCSMNDASCQIPLRHVRTTKVSQFNGIKFPRKILDINYVKIETNKIN